MEIQGQKILKVGGEGLTMLAEQAMIDIAHLLRPAHLQVSISLCFFARIYEKLLLSTIHVMRSIMIIKIFMYILFYLIKGKIMILCWFFDLLRYILTHLYLLKNTCVFCCSPYQIY